MYFFIVFCSYWFCTLFVNYHEDSEFNIFLTKYCDGIYRRM
ncbi:hypothetical protein AC73_3861 [Escherichia coli 2-427-07_S4_C1]|nr:hypothetical protein AC73_3861 [Escherichia coli 2-427-07_S4_C1]